MTDPLHVLADILDPPSLSVEPTEWVESRLGGFMWSAQRQVADSVSRHRYTAAHAAHGLGKALDVTTPIPTPTGWTPIGRLQAGDHVLDERGRPCTIIAVSETWEDRPCQRVTFTDGTSIIADVNHEWSVTRFTDRATRRRHGPVTDWRDEWDLAQIVETRGLAGITHNKIMQHDAGVPTTAPLDLPDVDLPVDPYVLGIYLAGGSRHGGPITLGRVDAEHIRARITYPHHVVPSSDLETSVGILVPGLQSRLKALGVSPRKHIPAIYLRASHAQRLALLHGIMDGGGFANRTSAGIDLMDPPLTAGLVELMRTLGLQPRVRIGDAAIYSRVVGERQRISVQSRDLPLFTLPRKQRVALTAQATIRFVDRVEDVDPRPTVCVTVDSPSHLFLAGEGMVPTHNSAAAARVVSWWIDTHPIGDAFVVTTAPTWPQVKAVLWREIARVRAEARSHGDPLPGSTNLACEWRVGDQLVAFGRKPADHDESGMQGIHARNVLVVVDEAGGIPTQLWNAIDALATNTESRVLAIGNPDDPTTQFARNCRPGSGWNVIHLDGLRSPNFTADALVDAPLTRALMESEGIEPSRERIPDWMRPLLLSPTWVEERIQRWGVDSPLFDAKVRGRFPDVDSDTTLIPPRLITEAQQRELPGIDPPVYGLDVARMGQDRTVLASNRGGVLRVEKAVRKHDTMQTVDLAATVLRAHKTRRPVNVDVIGVGAGVYDRLRQLGENAMPFNSSEKPRHVPRPGDPRFGNRRAEAWWALREAFEAGEVDLDPRDDDLASELSSLHWRIDKRGIIWVESKEEWVKRMGGLVSSPDLADAVMMAHAAHAASIKIPTLPPRDRITGGLLDEAM